MLQKIYIDFRLSTRLLPLALEDLCVARSFGIAQRVFLVLQRMPKSALWRGQIVRVRCFCSNEKTPVKNITPIKSVAALIHKHNKVT